MRLTYPNEPNPVVRIIGVRTLQTALPASVALALIWLQLPEPLRVPVAAVGGTAVTAALSASFIGTFNPRFGWGHRIVCRLPDELGSDAVALTFDDGPDPTTTPRLLEILKELDARATFFLVGERVERFPHLVRQVADAGHSIGAHGWTHCAMALQNGREIRRDLQRTKSALEAATEKPLPTLLLRPPYGFLTWTLCRVATRDGWQIIAWNTDGRDYDENATGETIARKIIEEMRRGSIVLLHERPARAEPTADALTRILADCRARGLRCIGL